MSLRRLIFLDYQRHKCEGTINALNIIFNTQGFWATTVYRLGRACYCRFPRGPMNALIVRCYSFVLTLMEIITGISIPVGCDIGEGLFISHFGNIILNRGTRIGKNCTLHQGVTLGIGGRGPKYGTPSLGDRVFIGANAVLIGNIHIGDDVAIGAGAVVTKSIPRRAVVVGNPAAIVSYNGSFDFIQYYERESDAERSASLNTPPEEATSLTQT